MTNNKLPIIIVIVIVLAGAGAYMSGMVGGKSEGPTKKHVVEPIALLPASGDSFLVNLSDPDGNSFLAVNVAVQLEPMDEVHWAAFSGAGGGGHGGGGEAPGPGKVATYPKFFDALQTVASGFTADQLLQPNGKQEFKRALLDKLADIADTDAAEAKSGAAYDDPTHVGPPYHVMDVFLTKFIVSQR